MNALIDHHRSAFQKAKIAPIAGSPGADIARDLQVKLLDPKAKPGKFILTEVPRGYSLTAFNSADRPHRAVCPWQSDRRLHQGPSRRQAARGQRPIRLIGATRKHQQPAGAGNRPGTNNQNK
jgi:hypothetical protein